MHGDGLFHIADDNRLTALPESPYEAESVLQALSTHHSDLLAGGQMDPDAPADDFWSTTRRRVRVVPWSGAAG